MEIEIGKTTKYLRDKQGVPDSAKEKLKEFNQIKKAIVEALKEHEMTIPQLAEKLQMSKPDVAYHLLTLVKYGVVAIGEIDDMDEYFSYKLVK
ncbi:winged helix-turn-helix domain-containing protein [Anaerorudis cellulosivorans]|uniref:winged helix-turn-helix domain-containing protein n=1 Tax=Anaerorudis cellulosivorans TaxID=3397862 RepID=UPI002220B8EE|nr:winged helix-turn-helix domain-containing protein [Seramator thermalis]MCW1734994.1 winged helix-turn-helix domain-containing protein [Seramator thermalis]